MKRVPDVEDGDLIDEVDAVRRINVKFNEAARCQFSNLVSWNTTRVRNPMENTLVLKFEEEL